jgi:hypothetical protein
MTSPEVYKMIYVYDQGLKPPNSKEREKRSKEKKRKRKTKDDRYCAWLDIFHAV